MKDDEITKIFFECLGEIWRDITLIEFLMRCAIARHDRDIEKFPQPPYNKGKEYTDYPDSFSHYSFEMITQKFNKRFPDERVPDEVIRLRDAMAHGIIADINHSGTDTLIKFRLNKDEGVLKVEFSLPLEMSRLKQLRQSLKEMRRYVGNAAKDPS